MNKLTIHSSMRGYFAHELYQHMKRNKKIWVITGDLGYGMLDQIRKDFPARFINVGAAEQAMIGVAIGLTLEGQIPFVYSITTFLIYRPFETIRNYINQEKISVRLIGSGRDKDYRKDGFSHWALENKEVMGVLKNIKSCYPETKEEIPALVEKMVNVDKPWYINLRR